MVMKRVRSLLERFVRQEHSPKKLALTICLGMYIGLSPFIGFRTILTFLCGWLFTLDLAILFAASFFVHNPWTILPLYVLDHSVGQWFFGIFNIDGVQLDPSWLEICSSFLTKHTGISGLSLSAFLVGGNLIGVCISVMMYPVVRRIIAVYTIKKNSSYITQE